MIQTHPSNITISTSWKMESFCLLTEISINVYLPLSNICYFSWVFSLFYVYYVRWQKNLLAVSWPVDLLYHDREHNFKIIFIKLTALNFRTVEVLKSVCIYRRELSSATLLQYISSTVDTHLNVSLWKLMLCKISFKMKVRTSLNYHLLLGKIISGPVPQGM